MYSLLAFTPRGLAWPVAFTGIRPFVPCRLLGGFGSTDLGAVLNAPQWLVVHTGNLPRLIRAAERARMWNELTFTYVHYDEFDNAAHVMIDHSADAWCGLFESHTHHACLAVLTGVPHGAASARLSLQSGPSLANTSQV